MADKLIGDVIAVDMAHARRVVGSQWVVTRMKIRKDWVSRNGLKMYATYGHRRA
jgi:hypothetical protein